jgi:hypothetical protein
LFPGEEVLEWTTEEGVVMVALDVQGRVIGKEFTPVIPVEPPSPGLRGIWMRLTSWFTKREPRVTGGID